MTTVFFIAFSTTLFVSKGVPSVDFGFQEPCKGPSERGSACLQCPVAEPCSSEATREADDASPVSVLEAPFIEILVLKALRESVRTELHVPEFKIRRGRIVEDVSPPHLASFAASGSRPTVLQGSETVVGNPPAPPAPEVRADIPSPTNPAGHGSPPGNVKASARKKPKVESGEQASRTPVSSPFGRREYINIGPRKDELDPSVVEKLPLAVALAATSVHKYWTSSSGRR
ncbi:Uncharacterized protein Fot_20138 [Forsythia ovata]|uniref:Uncharacterized protein n=1 Tax=Forsythia ovata TaxID=205694 RepID=A0ABD1VNC1_9LAMI